MNELHEMLIHKDSCEAFEKQLNKLGFQFTKDNQPWKHNDDCFIYHYSCEPWQQTELFYFLRDNEL